ncbi:MAG: hypothetical protein WCD70_11690 [Alphaproteobacteria bacterium]
MLYFKGKSMRLLMLALLISGVLSCVGCDANGTAQGGGTGGTGYGRVKLGIPF